jgi:hypothetical protein
LSGACTTSELDRSRPRRGVGEAGAASELKLDSDGRAGGGGAKGGCGVRAARGRGGAAGAEGGAAGGGGRVTRGRGGATGGEVVRAEPRMAPILGIGGPLKLAIF